MAYNPLMRSHMIPVTTLEEAEIVRNIRNECRDFMTGSSAYIQPEQQIEWFTNLDTNINKLYLCYLENDPIGYCLIAYKDGTPWLTGALKSAYRGQGYGKEMFSWMIRNCDPGEAGLIKLHVLPTNSNAYSLYSSLGFSLITMNDDIIEMEKSDKPKSLTDLID